MEALTRVRLALEWPAVASKKPLMDTLGDSVGLMIKLYPDQEALKQSIRDAMRSSRSVLAVAQTGAGKTLTSASMMVDAAAKGNTSWFMVPRRELLRQTMNSLHQYGVDFGVIASGFKANPFARIQLVTSGTVSGKLDRLTPPDILFQDEAHYCGAQIDRVVDWVRDAGKWRIGLTATPIRLDGRGLSRHYESMVEGLPLCDLIKLGRLSDFRYFAPYTPDLSGIRSNNGELSKKQLDEKMAADRVRVGSAIEHYKRLAMGKKNVCFNTSIRDAELTAEQFREAGIPTAAVYGKLGDDEIKRRVRALARGELLCLTSVEILTFGFDLSSAAGMDVTVESLSMMRPTESRALAGQMWGRALRKKPFPAIIMDHAGVSAAFGMPDAPQNWTLEGREKSEGEGKERTIPVRQCSVCYGVMRPCPVCIFCGNPFPVKDRTIEEVEGELIEVTREQLAQVAKQERMVQGRAQTLPELIELGKRRGVKNPAYWAKKVMEGRRARA